MSLRSSRLNCSSWTTDPKQTSMSTTGRRSSPPAPRMMTLRYTGRSKVSRLSLPSRSSSTATSKRTHSSPSRSKRSMSVACIDEVSAPVSSLALISASIAMMRLFSTQP